MRWSFSAAAVAAAALVLTGISGAAKAAERHVLVLPFASVNGGSGAAGVERALQHSLAGELDRAKSLKVITSTASPPTDDLAAAITAARAAGASHVVYGYYEMRGDRLSVMANTVDVANMHLMGGVNVERRSRDLWNAADALGTHVVGHLNGSSGMGVAAAGNQIGASNVSRVQMPLTAVPLSYVDFAKFAKPYAGRNPGILPGTVVVDAPLTHVPTRLLPASTDAGSPFSNTMQSGLGGNSILRGDGNVAKHPPHEMQSGLGNTIERGDGNTMSMNRGDTVPDRGFGNSVRPNYGAGSASNANVAGTGGNSVGGSTGNQVRSGSGNQVRSSSGSAVRPPGGNAVNPPNDR